MVSSLSDLCHAVNASNLRLNCSNEGQVANVDFHSCLWSGLNQADAGCALLQTCWHAASCSVHSFAKRGAWWAKPWQKRGWVNGWGGYNSCAEGEWRCRGGGGSNLPLSVFDCVCEADAAGFPLVVASPAEMDGQRRGGVDIWRLEQQSNGLSGLVTAVLGNVPPIGRLMLVLSHLVDQYRVLVCVTGIGIASYQWVMDCLDARGRNVTKVCSPRTSLIHRGVWWSCLIS